MKTSFLLIAVLDPKSIGAFVVVEASVQSAKVAFGRTNKWLHVVATYDSDTKLRLYKNGKLIKTGNGHAPVSALRSDQRIGRSHWNDNYLDAQLDELRIYSTGLSQADVNAIYGNGNGETPVAAPVITSAATATGKGW